jgi:hypothetical protein
MLTCLNALSFGFVESSIGSMPVRILTALAWDPVVGWSDMIENLLRTTLGKARQPAETESTKTQKLL